MVGFVFNQALLCQTTVLHQVLLCKGSCYSLLRSSAEQVVQGGGQIWSWAMAQTTAAELGGMWVIAGGACGGGRGSMMLPSLLLACDSLLGFKYCRFVGLGTGSHYYCPAGKQQFSVAPAGDLPKGEGCMYGARAVISMQAS